jgi:hypothetical protein
LETKRKATSKTASEKVENTKGNSMSEEDLREAIIDLLKKYPGSFGATIEQIQTAKIEHRDGYVQIGFFRCNLKSCTFAYGVFPTGPGQFKGGIGGAFFKDDNGKWTGKITRSIKT